jgi:hypothetical protein
LHSGIGAIGNGSLSQTRNKSSLRFSVTPHSAGQAWLETLPAMVYSAQDKRRKAKRCDNVYAPYIVKQSCCAELLLVSALLQDSSSDQDRKAPDIKTDDDGTIILTEDAHQVSKLA